MGKIVKFGEDVDGYVIPVLNEREVRAAAGILFFLMLVSILTVIMKGDFTLLKYAVTIFLTDMLVRVLINPKYAPTLIIGRWIVRNQIPEYVGAPQKKFAWIIGLVLAVTMFVLLNMVNSYSPITGLICLICIIFLFFESAFGICLGCKVYPLFSKGKVQYCPGEVCEVKDRHEIQKTSVVQWFIVVTFITYIVLTVFLLSDFYSVKPFDLFGLESPAH
ncbi:MAG TPA: DUF4395 domain-containing protein [Prolixibacteraceae bacterium]|nr:DUF4395 domain-containing protein [Prolixibacteraceae bacterium]